MIAIGWHQAHVSGLPSLLILATLPYWRMCIRYIPNYLECIGMLCLGALLFIVRTPTNGLYPQYGGPHDLPSYNEKVRIVFCAFGAAGT